MAKNRDDTGCSRAKELGYTGTCLECPFPECIEVDLDFSPTRFKRSWRNEEIRRKWKQGESPKDIAKKFDIDMRTVLRVVE